MRFLRGDGQEPFLLGQVPRLRREEKGQGKDTLLSMCLLPGNGGLWRHHDLHYLQGKRRRDRRGAGGGLPRLPGVWQGHKQPAQALLPRVRGERDSFELTRGRRGPCSSAHDLEMPGHSRERVKMPQGGDAAEWARVECAYCRGRGKDPFGLPSPKSNCCVCGGKGTVRVRRPNIPCVFCQATGIQPNRRLTCTVCRGKGVVHVREPVQTCPTCLGTGQAESEHDLPCTTCGGKGVVSG